MLNKEQMRASVWEEISKLTEQDIELINEKLKIAKKEKSIFEELNYLSYANELCKINQTHKTLYIKKFIDNLLLNEHASFEELEKMNYLEHKANISHDEQRKNMNIAA
ncbi:hypothetical protein AXY40_08950 [Staphylococcus saprophyticus]|nr:hypothetical protein AXY40_08950 [Staphylococcus saprophyticus]OAO33901.1 hypothetical protein AXY41_10650 [Staphylococcus saprophyticus]